MLIKKGLLIQREKKIDGYMGLVRKVSNISFHTNSSNDLLTILLLQKMLLFVSKYVYEGSKIARQTHL